MKKSKASQNKSQRLNMSKSKEDLILEVITRVDGSVDKIESKIDKLDSRLDDVDKTLVKQEAQLAEHIRRTNILEKELKPVKIHVERVNGAFKLLGIVASILGILKLLNLI